MLKRTVRLLRQGGLPVQILLSFGLLVGLMAGSSFLVNLLEEKRSLRAAIESEATGLSGLYASVVADALYLLDVPRGRLVSEAAASRENVHYAAIYDATGALFADSAGQSLLDSEQRLDPGTLLRAQLGPFVIYEVEAIRVLSPVAQPGRPSGVAEVRISLAPLVAATERIWSLNGAMAVVFLVLGMALSLLVLKLVSRPLERLSEKVRRVADGDLGQSMEVTSRDVMGELGSAFNQMAEALKTGYEERVQSRRLVESNQRLEAALGEVREMQGYLVHAEKLSAMGKLVSGVAHELNNPLTTVLGFAELLQRGELPDKQRREVALIVQAAERARRIVRDLLGGVHRDGERRVVSFEEVVDTALEQLRPRFDAARVSVRRSFHGRTPWVEGDVARLIQVATNLLANAADAIEEGSPPRRLIDVRTGSYGDGWTFLQVADSGPGVAAEVRGRIFDPFFTTKEVGKGTGLGLSLVRDITEANGGTVELRTEPGFGAVFEVRLPAVKTVESKESGASQERVAAVPAGRADQPLRILVADDEEAIRRMLVLALGRRGHDVETVANGRLALERCLVKRFDLVVLDIKMPEVDGIEVARALLARDPTYGERILVASGNILDPAVGCFLESSGLPVLGKPFTPSEIERVVHDWARGVRPDPVGVGAASGAVL